MPLHKIVIPTGAKRSGGTCGFFSPSRESQIGSSEAPMTIQRITIVGTGLIGASTGLALRAAKFPGEILGWDRNPSHLQIALDRGAIDLAADDPISAAISSDLVLLSGPVFTILDWLEK